MSQVSTLYVCLFTFVAAGVFCLVYFYFPLLFLFKIYFSNHKPFSFSGLPAKAVILRDEELLFAWQRLKDGSVPFSSGAISRDEAGSGKAALMKISSDQGESETLHCWVTTQPEAFCS